MTTQPRDPSQLWTVAGGGPGRRGLWGGRVHLEPEPIRRLPARGAVQASVVFDAEDRVLVADMAGWIQAFSSEGRPLWQRPLEGAVSASPAVDAAKGRVYVGTHLGWVYALSTADGAVLWRQRLPTQSDARIVADLLFLPLAQTVVMSSWGGRYHALEAETGAPERSWDAGISPQAGASADDSGTLYFNRAVRGEGVACVRLAGDGTETVLHRQPEGQRGAGRMLTSASPLVDDTRSVVYFCVNGDLETRVRAWSLREESLLWSREVARFTVATPALCEDGAVVLAGLDGGLRAFDASGTPRFSYATGAEYLLAGPVGDAEGNVFLGDPLGRVHAVDRAGAGRVLFEAPRSIQARPAFDRHGHLHVGCTDRTVIVFRNRLATAD